MPKCACAHASVYVCACSCAYAACVKLMHARLMCKSICMRTHKHIEVSIYVRRHACAFVYVCVHACRINRAQTRSSSANILMRCTESHPLRTSISSNAKSPTAASKSLTVLFPSVFVRVCFSFLPFLPRGTSRCTSPCRVSGKEYNGKGSGDGSEDLYRPGGDGDEYGAYREYDVRRNSSSSRVIPSCLTRLPRSFSSLRSVCWFLSPS